MPVPPQQPIVTFFNPNKRDLGLVEIWSAERPTDEPLDIGTPHPNTREYPNFRLGLQAAIQTEDGWWRKVWVTDETNPDWFNYEIKFAAEAVAFPTYIRQYRIDKKTYTPLTKGIPLGAVFMLRLATPGSGYTPGTFPAVNFSGGGGSGAIAHAIVNLDGTIADVVIDDGGTGYTTTPTATVDPPTIGVTATVTAVIQPQTAILIAEQAEEFPKDSEFFGLYLNVTRVYETLPGPTLDSTRIDDDGMAVTTTHRRQTSASVVSNEEIDSGNWIKRSKKETGNLFVAEQMIETRPVPGNPMVDVKIDKDGKPKEVVKTLKDTTTIVVSEDATGGTWTTIEKNAVSDLVAWEVVTARDLPGNVVPSATIGGDHEIANISTILRKEDLITPSATESGGFITTVEKREVTDLVSDQITTVKKFLDEAFYSISVPNLIPEWARPQIPTLIESHILAGTASQPTLGTGEFSASEKQLTKLLYERRVEKIADPGFPVTATNQELTEQFGGGVLNVTLTLDDNAQTIDEGLLVVSSETSTLAVYTTPPGVLTMKSTKVLDDTAWPVLDSNSFDKEMQVFAPEEEQVVIPTYSATSGTYFVESVRGLDKWRGKRSKITRQPTAVDVSTALVSEIDGPFQFPGLLYNAAGGYYVRRASAQLTQFIVRAWWMSSPTIPTRGLPGSGADVEIQDIIMDDIIISELNDTSRLAYSGMVLHDDITTFGVLFYPETIPNVTDYVAMIGTEIVIAATIEPTEIPELWKIETKSVTAR